MDRSVAQHESGEAHYPAYDTATTGDLANRFRKFISCAGVAAALLAATPAEASAEMLSPDPFPAPIQARPFNKLPPQGVFEDCFITHDLGQCEARAEQVAAAGFGLILNSDALDQGADMPTLLDYAETTQSAGLENIWMLDTGWWRHYEPEADNMLGVYPELTAESSASTNDGLLRYIVRSLRGKTWGYYIADDTDFSTGKASQADIAGMRELTNRIHELDPAAKTLAAIYGLDQRLSKLGEAVDVPLQENYPVGLPSDPHPDNSAGSLEKLGRQAKNTARAMCGAWRLGETPGAILQAFSWSDSLVDASNLYGPQKGSEIFASHGLPYPSAAQIRAIRNTTLQYGRPKVMLWFSLDQTLGWPNNEPPDGWYSPAPSEAASRWKALTTGVFSRFPRNSVDGSRPSC